LNASDALHARVVAAIESAMKESEGAAAAFSFDDLAVAIARFQAANVPAIARLARARGVDLGAVRSADAIPAVPCDVFRLARVAAHPPEQDARVFRTSGTSQGARGEHPFRTTATYARAALAWGKVMLWPDRDRIRVIVLAPEVSEAPDSSLGFMIDLFARALGDSASWHVRGGELDEGGLTRACAEARAAGDPALVLGTSFAFVHLLDATTRDARSLALPPGSRVMQTGGFKGRSREVEAGELRLQIAAAFEVPPSHVIAEYGMTELSSQLYEGTLAAALGALGARADSTGARAVSRPPGAPAQPGIYCPPPWVRVTAVDPLTLLPAPRVEGVATGLARIVDLANVDSAVAVQTSDVVAISEAGIRLLGRAPGATPRGCSLAIDAMLSRGHA
jgi:hypothetical protein